MHHELPKGDAERDELATDAGVRELREEAAWTATFRSQASSGAWNTWWRTGARSPGPPGGGGPEAGRRPKRPGTSTPLGRGWVVASAARVVAGAAIVEQRIVGAPNQDRERLV
jgi:8-oxo-dGTP pyrophosphatase MutT (NUDIX family)